MALWKPFRGSRTSLDNVEKHDGYVYFCTDDGTLFFDYVDSDGNLQRKQINAKDCESVLGLTLEEIQKSISWNDLLDRPFGDNEDGAVSKLDDKYLNPVGQTSFGHTLVIGDIHQYPYVDFTSSKRWYKVSDNTPTDFTGMTLESNSPDMSPGDEITMIMYDGYACSNTASATNAYVLFVAYGNKIYQTEVLGPGIYVQENITYWEGDYIGSITLPNHEFTKSTIKEEYIPDTIARVSDIPDGGVQADMAQNDSAEPDYIKNRTHWKEELGVQALFDGTIETDYGWNTDQGVPAAIEIKIGTTYSVVYDGATYAVVGKVGADNIPYIGSDSLWDNDSYVETEEPFCYGDGWFGASVDGIHTVVISGEATEWHAIEKEYLPGVLIRPGDGYKSEVFNDTTNTASGTMSHAEGSYTSATGDYSHVEGCNNTASGTYSHAEGYNTEASGWHAHTEGYSTVASGNHSHAEGRDAVASGFTSHAEGRGTTAAGEYQHVQGKYNIVDESSIYAHIVGNGGVRGMESRSNAHTIDWFGNAWFRGDLRVGGTNYDDAISLLPKCTTITLSKDAWTGSSNPWSQAVTVNGVTANSRLELCPTAEQIVDLQASEITLMLQNDSGTVTAWAINNKPTSDLTLQVLITEVIPV